MRYSAVDFFRGLTIAFMIIVNTPGNWTHVYPPLRHAVWHGFTPTDLVFPSFMYIIGVSMWFAFAKFDRRWSPEAGRKIVRRTILLFGVGLILNNFPFLWKNWDTWRIMGVPQRLALGYGIASVLVLNLGRRALIGTSIGLLLLYWGLLNWFVMPGADPYGAEGSAVLRLDRWLFGVEHLYHETVAPGVRIPFDPEGVLSTLPAIVTVLLGWLSGNLLHRHMAQKDRLVRDLLAFGLICVFLGLGWDLFFPINKKLWTSSFVLYAGGYSMVLLAISVWVLDVKGWKKAPQFFIIMGINALFAYVLSEALVMLWSAVSWTGADGAETNIREWLYNALFHPLDGGGALSSAIFAVAYMLLCWVCCWYLYRRKIFIKL
ncbi:MAG: DUF1624 domain-containing protein [Saprospiraceae bacterium]|nr:DUF1624 domain-containing protein [Saprospiraceae bacterium]